MTTLVFRLYIINPAIYNIFTVHAYYRYPDGMIYRSVKEEERWEKVILKKLNETVRTARKRYRRVHNMPAPTGIDSVGRISIVLLSLLC